MMMTSLKKENAFTWISGSKLDWFAKRRRIS
jgi:hypothetical protein